MDRVKMMLAGSKILMKNLDFILTYISGRF